ncbi:MAG: DUF6766 family protein [Rhodanobacter sp.]
MQSFFRRLKDNSLSIVLFALFAVCLVGHSVASWHLHNQQLAAHGQAAVDYWKSLLGSSYLEELASNWQAAFLQLASLILFSGFLYQRGAPHSRNPDKVRDTRKKRAENARFPWLYRHSMSVAFLSLFALTFVVHTTSGYFAWNEHRALLHLSPLTLRDFLLSAKFWSSTLETWQAEYLTIALFIVFSVFLHEQDSAESKPVEASAKETGKAND